MYLNLVSSIYFDIGTSNWLGADVKAASKCGSRVSICHTKWRDHNTKRNKIRYFRYSRINCAIIIYYLEYSKKIGEWPLFRILTKWKYPFYSFSLEYFVQTFSYFLRKSTTNIHFLRFTCESPMFDTTSEFGMKSNAIDSFRFFLA